MFKIVQKKSLHYLQASLFQECDFLTHAFCTRQGGASREDYASLNLSFRQGDAADKVLQNWGRLAEAFAIPVEQFLVVNQVHGDGILVVGTQGGSFSSPDGLDYDAIVTSRPGLAIGIKTADCVPVFIVDKVQKVIAVVHAGWRGSAAGISAKVIKLLQRQYLSDPQDLLAAIGPAIGKCCYEVDFVAAGSFAGQKNPEAFLFRAASGNKWMLDLPEANRRQLLDCGIPEQNIELSGYCTVCRQNLFFSHRGSGGNTGRQINFMMIKEEKPSIATTLPSKASGRE